MTLCGIQILRAIAALMVVMHHAQGEAAILAARRGLDFAPSGPLPWPAGVDVFFVISGFIIVQAAGPLYRIPGGRRRFLAHRIARLVPLYWLASALYLAVVLAAPALVAGGTATVEPGYVAASFLFWPVLDADGRVEPLYSLGWTLQCEMAFYVLFCVGLGWGRRAAFAWIAFVLSGLGAVHVLVPGLPTPLAFWSAPIGLEFVLGAAIGLARAEGSRLSPVARLAVALAGLALLAVAPEPDAVSRPLAYGVPAMLLVAAAGLGPSRRPEDASWPRLSAIRLGDASYALYLVHPFALRGARMALSVLAVPLPPAASVALMIGLSVALALFVHCTVERPLVRLARALLDPRAPARENPPDDPARRVPRDAKRH